MKKTSIARPEQAGFTLIELIIVILIVGILSAVALPRFFDMGSSARAAKANAILGSMRAASQIVRAASLVNSNMIATGAITVDGVSIHTNYGFPQAVGANGIIDAAGLDSTTNNADQITLTGASATGGSTLVIAVNNAPGTCTVSYTSPSALNVQPTIVPNTTGC